jgi:hypothetical protein
MLVYNYQDYLFEAEAEDKLQPFILSPKLRGILQKINSPASNAILKMEQDGSKTEITYLDCVINKEKIDKITYLPSGKSGLVDPKDFWTSKLRQETTIGRVINKFLTDIKLDPKLVEAFVNEFKGMVLSQVSDFKLVEGEDVRFWYWDKNYAPRNRGGDIYNSCMCHKDAQPYLSFYVENPDKVKLLIKTENDKLVMRALVWHELRKPEGRIFVDRVYAVNAADVNAVNNYAKSQGWLHKAHNVMRDATYVDGDKVFNNSITVQLKPKQYKSYPSLDTLQYFTPGTGRLSSVPGNYVQGFPRIQLNCVGGNFSRIDY